MEMCIWKIVFDFFFRSHMSTCRIFVHFYYFAYEKKLFDKKLVHVMRLCERNRTKPGDRNKAGAKNTRENKNEVYTAGKNMRQNCDYYYL